MVIRCQANVRLSILPAVSSTEYPKCQGRVLYHTVMFLLCIRKLHFVAFSASLIQVLGWMMVLSCSYTLKTNIYCMAFCYLMSATNS